MSFSPAKLFAATLAFAALLCLVHAVVGWEVALAVYMVVCILPQAFLDQRKLGVAISVTPASVVPSAAALIRKEINFGATTVAGDAMYYDTSTGKWKLLDIDVASGVGIADLRGIATAGGGDGQPGSVCVYDTDFTYGGTLTTGLTIYGFTTAGDISHDVPASGSYTIFFGIAKSTTKGILNPLSPGVAV